MARPAPAAYRPVPVQALGALQPIHEGSAAGLYGELDLAENVQHLFCATTPPWVQSSFNSDAGYIGATGAMLMHTAWRRRIIDDLPILRFVFWAANTSGADAGTVRIRIASTGTVADTAIPAGAAAWTRYTGTIALDGATARNIVELWAQSGATGQVRVRSLHAWPEPLAVVAAGVTTDGYVALDDQECSSADPVTTYLRRTELANLDVVRSTRTDTICCWGEAYRTPGGTEAYSTTSTSYVVVARLPYWAHRGQDAIEWAVNGSYAGASGTIRLRTGHMIAQGIAAVTAACGAAWATPYNNWVDDGVELTALPEHDDYVEIAMVAGAASTARLWAFAFWFADIDT